jgi:hypothetical protein
VTVAEIKSGIEKSKPEKRAYFAALIRQLARKDDLAYLNSKKRVAPC